MDKIIGDREETEDSSEKEDKGKEIVELTRTTSTSIPVKSNQLLRHQKMQCLKVASAGRSALFSC